MEFCFFILIFGSLNQDERIMRLKKLAICENKKSGLLLFDSFVSKKIRVSPFNNDS
jgi:hypothetical protein